ncbi:MAG: hypothetical protein QNJ31_04225 [Candidatus Caenarcaniphilales bacterium]|nr:hypothetical protein [Candidatus Caenarcaniphilales bacterium]
MFSSKENTTLLDAYSDGCTSIEFYGECKKHISILQKASQELGYESLLDFLKSECEQINFQNETLYVCSERIWEPETGTLLAISHKLQILFFSSLEYESEILNNSTYKKNYVDLNNQGYKLEWKSQRYYLKPLPKVQKQEIFTQIDQKKGFIFPYIGNAPENLITLGITYFGSDDKPIAEMWRKKSTKSPEAFFSGDGAGGEYNTDSPKFGFKVEENKIKLIVRKGNLDKKSLKKWRQEIKKNSLCYVLGLQPLEMIYGTYARRSVFVFGKNGDFLLHVRTSDLNVFSIKEHLKVAIRAYLLNRGITDDDLIILLSDGDSNACTYIPDHPLSDRKALPLGVGLAVCSYEQFKDLESRELDFKYSINYQDVVKEAFVGVWRYKKNPIQMFERIRSNLNFYWKRLMKNK